MKMKKTLQGIIDYSLTNRQKEVFIMYHVDRKKMPEIASILGIHKSNVSRALNGAQKKIDKLKKGVKV
jgi:RNA polymerase sigma factor (sigma-70 family)